MNVTLTPLVAKAVRPVCQELFNAANWRYALPYCAVCDRR